MKLKRIAAMPFALVADAVSLGNIGGGRSFTQQLFDAEQAERTYELVIALARVVVEAKRAEGKDGR